MVEISKASALCFWRTILKLKKESTRWAPLLLNEEQKCVHVRTERKLLKRFSRYDHKIFMNEVVGDESWIHYFEPHRNMAHQKCKNALYCHKDYQCKNYYVYHNFHYKGTSNPGPMFYKKKVLRKLVKFYQKHQSKASICGIYLLHDNALSHKAGSMTPFLKEQPDYFKEHSPYSPDGAPVTFFSSLVSRKVLMVKIYLPPKARCCHI